MKLALAAILSLGLASTVAAQPRYVPGPAGAPFSAAVQVGDILYLAGQLGNGPDGKIPAGMQPQAKQAMENVAAILKGQGLSMNDVFKCSVFLADMSQWGDFNKIYVTYFDAKRLPARSALGANGLAGGALLEIECWAYAGKR
jgi:reactive intermediate/imine deaminase